MKKKGGRDGTVRLKQSREAEVGEGRDGDGTSKLAGIGEE